MNDNEIVYLRIYSWAGLSLGAQHYYGELSVRGSVWEHPSIKLTHILTSQQAAKANRYRDADSWLNVKVGDESGCFDSREEVLEPALKTWQTHFPQGRILIEGRAWVGDPQLILVWSESPELMKQANKLYEEFEAFEGYQYKKNWSEATRLNDEWDAIVKLEWE